MNKSKELTKEEREKLIKEILAAEEKFGCTVGDIEKVKKE